MTEIKFHNIDTSAITISVDRGTCKGGCPSYCLTIKSGGELTFKGRRNVDLIGVDQRAVPPDLAAKFAKKLLELDFFDLPTEIDAGGPRNSTTMIVLTIGSQKKCVAVTGDRSGIGSDLEQIATEIDHITGSSAWINGSNLSGRP